MVMFDTPLWPAGHLPLKGGDYAFISLRYHSFALQYGRSRSGRLISPLEGEMAGRPEGGGQGIGVSAGDNP